MANIELLVPKILQWEGGFVNDPVDRGGTTNKGITIATFRTVFGKDKTVEDLKALTDEQFMIVLKRYYWDRWRADEIVNQSVAEILVDWVWGSGKWGIIIPQRILNTDDDGVVGPITIAILNEWDQVRVHDRIKEARYSFINELILNHPEQERFRKGWKNRINSYLYSEL
jgi:lysozyme family protein